MEPFVDSVYNDLSNGKYITRSCLLVQGIVNRNVNYDIWRSFPD
jgi:hypothetical protein